MCTVCGKQFHRSDYLKLHSFQHTDERPFYCPICNKGFKMNYNLKIHLRNHEAERIANLQDEEKDNLKNEYSNLDIDEQILEESQQEQEHEFISLLAHVEDDEIEDINEDNDDIDNNHNKYDKMGSYVISSNDEFNFTSYSSNSNIKITSHKDQINNLNLDTLNF